jgi:DNA gyrase subunit A
MEAGTAPVEGVLRVDIDDKMRTAYLSYAMSVITARALPDVRDGLKPVQRRILYAMGDMGLRHDQQTRKSARIVGEVLGKYHPHGDSAVYDAMVRMAQDFSMRYPLVDGQGNFGSIDGDGAAALRYTEARLSALGEEMLLDLEKDTVDFVDNFDGLLQEPTVLPAKVPNLLINGVGGIAVGMATNIPPHNLGEVVDAIGYLIDHYDRADDVTVDDLLRFIAGPDFPTGGIILGREGIRQAYATGRGRVVVRAQAHIEDMRGHAAIIVTELPYQVNKASLVERIADLWRNGRIDGVSDLRDESDRTGMRIVIELKRGVDPSPVLGYLLKYTQMQSTFGVHMLSLVDGEPRLLSLKRMLLHYIDHRYDVIMRRTRYELERARARAHILEGLLVALDNLDAVITTIRRSQTAETAEKNLCKKFALTEVQARAILEMQLRRLAALERKRIQEEYQQVLERIEYLQGLLASKAKVLALIKEDALDLKKRFGDARRTRITDQDAADELVAEDLVPDEDLWVVLTGKGLVRRFPVAQRAKASGVPGMVSGERDTVHTALAANCRDSIIFLTDGGRAFKLPGHQLPDVAQHPRGLALSSLVRLAANERVRAVLHVDEAAPSGYLTLGTRQGKVKRVEVAEMVAMGSGGAQVIGLADDDALVWGVLTSGEDELVLVTAQGRAIRFQEDTVRPQGRAGTGVRGISLIDDDVVVAGDVARPDGELVLVTEQGYAKRTSIDEYSTQGRGGQGVMAVDGNKLAMTGPVACARTVMPGDAMAFATSDGETIHTPVSTLAALGRPTWGRLVTRTRRGALIQDGTIVWATRLEAPADAAGARRSGSAARTASKRARDRADGRSDGRATAASRGRKRSSAKAEASEPTAATGASSAKRRSATASKGNGADGATPSAASTRKRRSSRTRTAEAANTDAAAGDAAVQPKAAAAPTRKRAARAKPAADDGAAEAKTKATPRTRSARAKAEADGGESVAPQKRARTTADAKPKGRAKASRAAQPPADAAEQAPPADAPSKTTRRTRRATPTRPPSRRGARSEG